MTQMFGSLSIVILMSDFFQFPPVNLGAKPLWRVSESSSDQEGKIIWERFQDIIILEESMQYSLDLPFQEMLARARKGTMQKADLTCLNQ